MYARRPWIFALFSCLALSSVVTHAAVPAPQSTIAQDLLGNLALMKTVYEAEYAPADWKKKFSGYDLNTEYRKAVKAVRENPSLTLTDARKILKDFIYAMKDYHVSILFESTETAKLPFTVRSAGGKYFIVHIDRSKLGENSFPFSVGDELVSFDGKPTAEAVAEVQEEIAENVIETDRALAELALTSRNGRKAYRVPSGPVTIEVRPKGSEGTKKLQLVWDYTPEQIRPRGDLSRSFARVRSTKNQGPSLFRPFMDVRPEELIDLAEENPYGLGTRKAFTPELGTKIWESGADNQFHAYIYRNEAGKLIGYLRLPGYVVPDYMKAVADFGAILSHFEVVTDALVIDQVNNPGGSVFYLYTLASMLAKEPLATPRHRMSINQSDVTIALAEIQKLSGVKDDASAKKLIPSEEMHGYPTSYELAQFRLQFCRFIVDEWNAGRKLTRPYWIDGVDHINPAKNAYTKPVLVLTNELDFSGGDFFPAILQDNKRVTVMGTRTAGAGGYVNNVEVRNNLGISYFRVTGSLAERVDLNPIENLGVTPDVPYTMTENDLQNGYVDYVKAIRSTVDSMAR